MIEIIILIYVLTWFSKTAKRLGKKPKTWVFIALLSYLIPILIISFIVFPSLIIGWINKDNELIYQLVLLPINLIFGVSGILIAKSFLISGHLPDFIDKKRTIIICITTLIIILIGLIYYSFKYKVSHSENFVDFKNIGGVKKLENGLYREAIADFNDFLKKYPNEHTAYYNRGTAYGQLGIYDSAIVDFKKVISFNKFSSQIEHLRTYKFIGQSYLMIHQSDSALVYIKTAHTIMPENESVTIILLDLYRQLNNHDEFCKLIKSIDNSQFQFSDSIKLYSEKCK